MKTILSLVAVVTLLASPVAAQDETAERCDALPAPVARMRDAIRAAAAARDYPGLVKLIDPAEFTYSFGEEGGDPVPYWKTVDAGDTDIRATIVAVLDMGCAVATYEDMTEYVWPAAAALPYADLTAGEKAALEKLYPGRVADQYIEGPDVGYYAAWRLYIGEDGHWTSFVAGD